MNIIFAINTKGYKVNQMIGSVRTENGGKTMADREKVIKGLEYHLKELSVGKTCFECPYCGNNPCEIHLITDAIAMLKEQETREKNRLPYSPDSNVQWT